MNFIFSLFSLSCLDWYARVINYHVYSPESGLSENEDKMNPKVKLKQKSYFYVKKNDQKRLGKSQIPEELKRVEICLPNGIRRKGQFIKTY